MGSRRDDFDGSQVITTETMVLFWQPPGIFGQWTHSPFIVDGVPYVCGEQFMMAEKARLFGDSEVRARILKSDSPREQKALGRQVRGFEQAVWERERLPIVIRGNRAKFGQDPELRRALLATGARRMVEASPLDRIWGVGLRADDPRVHDPQQWRGLNLLGDALETVRDQLRAESREEILP